MIRPVHHLLLNSIEYISPLEQVYLNIACVEEDIRNDKEYQELNPTNILSILASNIPFLEYNQSPRNMYQCQMAKPTMGTPFHNLNENQGSGSSKKARFKLLSTVPNENKDLNENLDVDGLSKIGLSRKNTRLNWLFGIRIRMKRRPFIIKKMNREKLIK